MTQPTQTPSITFLNLSGDVTITWDKTNEEQILSLIEEKMRQGFSFFILKPRALGFLPPKKVLAKSMSQVARAGKVSIADADVNTILASKVHDQDVQTAVESGAARLERPQDNATYETERRASSAREVLQHQSVAVRPVLGG
jgi:hypothetical protein